MVYVRSVSSLLIMKLLAVNAKDKIYTDCKKKKCDFGEPFEVSFKLDKDADSCCDERWIGIFESNEKNPSSDNALFRTVNACSIGQDPDDNCTDLKKGNVVFDNIDPSENDFYNWPASPDKYKICHLNFADEQIQKCGKVEVVLSSKIKKDIKKKAFVQSTKEVYDYGEDIIADFDFVYAYPNSMVSIFTKANNDFGYHDRVDWVYTGCNNVAGDQRWSYNLSSNCIKTQRSGKVMFTPNNSRRAEYLDGGEYVLKINYYFSHYQFITDASSSFLVNPKPVSSKSPSSKSPSSKAPSIKNPN